MLPREVAKVEFASRINRNTHCSCINLERHKLRKKMKDLEGDFSIRNFGKILESSKEAFKSIKTKLNYHFLEFSCKKLYNCICGIEKSVALIF